MLLKWQRNVFNQGYTLVFKKTLKSVIEIIAEKININVIQV